MASCNLGDLLGRARGDDGAAAVSPIRAEIDDSIRRFDDVEVMLDDEHGVA